MELPNHHCGPARTGLGEQGLHHSLECIGSQHSLLPVTGMLDSSMMASRITARRQMHDHWQVKSNSVGRLFCSVCWSSLGGEFCGGKRVGIQTRVESSYYIYVRLFTQYRPGPHAFCALKVSFKSSAAKIALLTSFDESNLRHL